MYELLVFILYCFVSRNFTFVTGNQKITLPNHLNFIFLIKNCWKIFTSILKAVYI